MFSSIPLPRRRSAAGITLCCAAIALAAPARAADSVPVTVTLDLDHPGRTLPADFLGLSYETERLLPDPKTGAYYFRPDNTPLINMFKTLGVKCLRVGGNTVDRATVKIPDEQDIDPFFAFAKAAGVKVIYTLRLKGGSPETSAKTAAYIWSKYRDQMMAFAVGNEPNVFTSDYNVFLATWKKHEEAILRVAPEAQFAGPAATSGKAAWAKDFATEFASTGKIAAITYHLYPGGNSGLVTDPARGRSDMLSTKWVDEYQKMADGFVPAVLEKKMNFRLQEANSFWNGGRADVSDTHAAAIWALDYLYWWAAHGAGGLNFHTGDVVAKENTNTPCYYSLFVSTVKGYDAHPVAYAFKAFDLALVQGQGQWIPATISSNADKANFTAYALKDNEATVVTLINKEIGPAARTVSVTIHGDFKSAITQSMTLANPGGNPAAKVTLLGGSPINENGTWNGKWSKGDLSGNLEVTVPPTTATVFRILTEF